MDKILKSKLIFIFTLIVFGTVGVVSSFIPLGSSAIVFYRAVLSALFLFVVTIITKRKIGLSNIKSNFILLIVAGIFMGLNWVLQFESFKRASVSVGTVCYNTMPIFVILISPIMFGEKLTIKRICCVIIATIGVVLVSNVIFTGIKSNEIIGCIFGLGGALFYALVVMVTKKMNSLDSYDKLIFEFIVAAIIMIPYMIFIDKSSLLFDSSLENNAVVIGIIMLLLLCFFHTGFTYVLYFNSVDKLKAQEVAILTYIDPVVALVLSYFVLNERLNIFQIVGAILILFSTFINEINIKT